PSKYDKADIVESFISSDKKTKESIPLTVEMLEKAKLSLSEEHFNWLKISLWFGLRPNEVDSLKKLNRKDHTSPYFEKHEDGKTDILVVYQSKLRLQKQKDRWKYIPLCEPEQIEMKKIITEGNFKRPLVKTLQLHIDEELNNYGGRKGFTDLMK